jgi:iron(III) transport system substrate-binding protein
MRAALIALTLILILGVPFLLKPKENLLAQADDTVVIMTPHNEAIRYEFTRAFAEYYRQKTGRSVRVDWRMPGGTSEIARYLKGEFYSSFQAGWIKAGHAWTNEVAASFDNPRVQPSASPETDTLAQAARRAFLNSERGIGVDLFFGGGAFDFIQQADAGRLVDCGILQRHPDWFAENSLPQTVSGETYYDKQGRWIGVVLSAFGICYNTDSLRRLGVTEIPSQWSDLSRPEFVNQVALADPTKSGSAAKAFEMIIQQQMQIVGDQHLDEGWARGLNIIQASSANARYFTDAASRVPMDVSMGDAALGMSIDFYARFQSETVQIGDKPSRLQYFTPAGGSSIGADPIGLLRGAPNADVARMFIDFVVSIEGQKLWNFRVGTPGGPVRYALRRLPIRKELYAPEYTAFRSDPTVFPYEEARLFTYHPAWTGSLFKTLSFVIRVLCLDCHDEQVAAWKALIAAGFPPQATAKFRELGAVDYRTSLDKIRPILSSADRIGEVRLARELGEHFRDQYRAAEQLAKEGK